MRAPLPGALLLATLLASCGGDDGDGPRAYETDGGCQVRSAEPLADTDPTLFGPTVAALFAPAVGEHQVTLTYEADGASTPLTIRVALADEPALLVEQRADPETEVGWCRTDVQRRATVSYETADGRFDETFETVLRAEGALLARSSSERRAEALVGSDVPPAEVADADRVVYYFDAELGAGLTQGRIGVAAETITGDVVSLRLLPVAGFSASAGP